MRTTMVMPRAALLFSIIILAVTCAGAEVPSFGGLNGWTPGSNNNPYNPDPTSNSNSNNNNDENTNNTNEANENNSGTGNGGGNSSGGGSGSGSENGNGNGNGNGNYGNNNGGIFGGAGYGGGGDYGNFGGYSSPFGPGLDGLNEGLQYTSVVSYRVAHGALAAVAFAFLFPLGAILLRSVSGKGAVVSHWVLQVIASALYVIAAGLGLYLLSVIRFPAGGGGLLDVARGNAHPIIGIVLLVALFFQPAFGVLHHRRFKKLKRRTWASYVHLWIGRLGITLGIINGGLGLALAGVKGAPVVAYIVISSFMWGVWVLVTLLRSLKDSRMRRDEGNKEVMPKIMDEDSEYLARARRVHHDGARSEIAAAHMENTGSHINDSAHSRAAAAAAATVSVAEQDIPSPPYTPGPHYEAHMAHVHDQQQRQFGGGGGGMQSIKEAMDMSDTVPIISASQDEMRRGQV